MSGTHHKINVEIELSQKEDLIHAFREFAQNVLPLMIEKQLENTRLIQTVTFSVKEAAIYLGVHQDTVKKLIREKHLPHARIAGCIKLRPATLDAYMAEQERKSTRPS